MGDSDSQEVSHPTEIKFDFIKSNYFRVIHADGVWGGLTPSLGMHLSFFNERSPIPKQVVHEVGSIGQLGAEIVDRRIERDALVREVEVDIVMGYEAAKSLHQWLSEKLGLVEKERAQRIENLKRIIQTK